jgi:DNA-binding PadR family transcriptional regulator
MGGPHHGYLLREILNWGLGPFRQVSWGALYPLIHQLERQGLIQPEAQANVAQGQATPNKRQRNLYRITQAGQERFHSLMLEPCEYSADTPELFLIKLLYFGSITRPAQLTILYDYHGYLQILDDYLQRGERYVVNHPYIPESERSEILRAIHFRINSPQSELRWIDAEIARLTEQQEEHTP